ncbi:MAG: hypothetical protein ABIR46_03560 [Candidatus Saccharimonadales bacterium]
MADSPSSDEKSKTSGAPEAEELKPQSDKATPENDATLAARKVLIPKKSRHGSYRPSHKATFIGVSVVIAVLLINGIVIYFILRGQGGSGNTVARDEVTLSAETLDGLGVSRNSVGELGTELTIGPATTFNGSVTVAGDTSIGGSLKLNSKFSASDASLAKLQAGDTSLNTLNVNGDTTSSNLNLRNDLNVTGLTRLQGAVTMAQILTVNNSVNIAGNLAVGGTLSARAFQASSLVSDTTLVVGGHIITRGSAPGVSAGGAAGSNGTVSISGNDAAGTVAVNAGVGAGGGIVANITFRSPYGGTPHVVVTAVGPGASDVYINRNANGFSIGVGALTTGGHAFDYIVIQ